MTKTPTPGARPPRTPSSLMLTRRRLLGAGAGAGALLAAAAPGVVQASPSPSPSPAPAREPALHVLNRLAHGPAPGDLDRVRRQGVDAWIDAQLAPDRLPVPPPLQAALAALPLDAMSARARVLRFRELEQQVRREPAPAGDASSARQASPARRERHDFVTGLALQTAQARLARAVLGPRQLEESMVDFWLDHFNVFEGKGLVKVLVGAYERDAIRPHALGRFRDLLGATARHPAMLFYLDNWLSVAPGWQPHRATKDGPHGLNENYARELMELHTLGVDGGYTQADVTQLARVLTGWTFASGPRARSDDDLFVFDADRHDPGAKRWLGQDIVAAGQAEGEQALDVLARHPATARHLATRLARRFVADDAPPALVDHLARVFLDTDGDLRAVMRALCFHPAFRQAASRPPQYKTPWEFVVSAARAAGLSTAVSLPPRPFVNALGQLGQPLYGCPTPDGWPHAQSAWLNPEGVTRRIQFATALATGRVTGAGAGVGGDAASSPALAPIDLPALLATLGPAITPATRALVDAAPPALQAAMVLGSPDFMHR